MNRRSSTRLALGAMLLLQACIHQSQVEDRTFDLPDAYSRDKGGKRRAAAASKADRVGRWWKVFADDKLDKLMGNAFEHNLSLAQARARVAQARAQLMTARAGWLPSISGSALAGRSKRILNENIQFENNTLQLSLQASYEFDIWGKTRYAHKAAGHTVTAAKQDLRAGYITLAAEVAEAYYLAVTARAQLALLTETIENRKRQLDLVKRRYGEGVVTAVDLYQALGALARGRAERPAFERQLKVAEHSLALLLGRYPGGIDAGVLDELPVKVRQLPPSSPKGLLLQRPDLRAAHQRLLATDAQVGAALANHFPSLSFIAELGKSFDPSGFFWSILGSLTAPLFQGGRTHGEYKRREAVLQEQLAGFKATLLQAVKEVEDALVTGRTQEARVQHLEESAKVAEGALRLSVEQYAQGLTSYLNVLSSEQSVYSARSELIAARRELVSARIQLARALGGGWMETDIARAQSREQRGAATNGEGRR